MGKVYQIGKGNPAEELIGDAAEIAGDLAYALACFGKGLPFDECPAGMNAVELKGLIAIFHRQAEKVCEILASA